MTHTCLKCRKDFPTQQKLDRHKAKKFPCSPPLKDGEKKTYSCPCGKIYTTYDGLYKHRKNCNAHLMKVTQKILTKPSFTLNSVETLDLQRIDLNALKETYDKLNEEDNIDYKFRCRNHQIRGCAKHYKDTYIQLIKDIFFNTPSNYIFYVPNILYDEVHLYNEGEKSECEMKDLQEMMIDTASDFIDQVLQYYNADTHHPFAFMQTLRNEHCGNNDTHEIYDNMFASIKDIITKMCHLYRDDIKAVWDKVGILP